MARNLGPLLYFAIILVALDLFAKADAPPKIPLVKADMPYCFTIKNPPLGKPHRTFNGAAPVSALA